METKVADGTILRVAVPLIVPTVAVMVVEPSPLPVVAKPWLPAASLMVATPLAEEVQ